jgi:dTDP-4-amino-4,6-dideoxygalactose transaminase
MSDSKVMVTRSSMPSFEEYCNEIRPIWDSHFLTNQGPKHQELEVELKDYLKVPYIDLFVNGHSALECAIETFSLGEDGRDEVITTPFSFASTTHAISRKGLKPIFCDVRNDNCTIDVDKIEELITDRTCAIVPVHVYGNVCDVDRIKQIAEKYGLTVIYDAAHAFGVEYRGCGIGNFGNASMFSFHATKVFNTIEGGAITYSDGTLKNKFAEWRNFGIVGPESVVYVGGNSKMNEFSAAMGICNLRHVDSEILKREKVFDSYVDALGNIPGIRVLIDMNPDIKKNYAYLPIFVDANEYGHTRNQLHDYLRLNNFYTRKYFYPLINDYQCYREMYDSCDTPVARVLSEGVLCLPMFADLTSDQIGELALLIKNY